MEGFDIDEVQAEYVAEIKLRSLHKEKRLRHHKRSCSRFLYLILPDLFSILYFLH